ncbi:prephenate dehydrogenase [Flexivirga endophytica]|uniref:Prephenate dehydrogenase n=1 Tax=Flexivirga endophytica TaxID=1849103 RepID=A0A916T9J5_9MICO|nr:prephenate dehydrogenase [Flexivirga endophytica]GGB36835.1 prephenate dehydrogenase [Flexivirga endophytica]GHB44386.1 prephenate dehydrogenase [Flexivirga endophytica]
MTVVRVVGTGLIGTSIGLALSHKGFRVLLSDPSPTAQALAADLGAGAVDDTTAADLVFVAAPPDVAARVVADQLRQWPDAVVADVASVKQRVADQIRGLVDTDQLRRYVGSHPMAGRERSGAVAAQADLFEGRTWVVCPQDGTDPAAVGLVQQVAHDAGAAVVTMPADEHDAAVAVVSHLPQLAASVVAAQLRDLPDEAIALSGGGIRDVTRIAESDPMLWTQILAGNASSVTPVLQRVVAQLDAVARSLGQLAADDAAASGSRGEVARLISDGQLGHARIPGKHGAAPATYATVIVPIPDEPGAFARLFNDVGDAGINLEDLRMEHGVGAPVGLVELSVLPAAVDRLRVVLEDKGWSVHE